MGANQYTFSELRCIVMTVISSAPADVSIQAFVSHSIDTYPVKPLIKWAGGKRLIADELLRRFPEDWNKGTYVEPFIGGGAVFLHVAPSKAIIADVNARLYGFYLQVKNNPDELYEVILELAMGFNETKQELQKDAYLELRNIFNLSAVDSLESAAHLYALNKLCFNGLYRENSKGGFNVPFGQKRNLQVFSKEDLEEVSKVLQDTLILNSDFETTLGHVNAGDFVYLDPPYVPLDTTASFTSYHANGFGLKDQERLAEQMKMLSDSGAKVMCSNSDTPLTHEIFGSFNIQAIQAPRMVSAKASGRGSVSELVITSYL